MGDFKVQWNILEICGFRKEMKYLQCGVLCRVEPCVVMHEVRISTRFQSPDNRKETSSSAREMRIAGDQDKRLL